MAAPQPPPTPTTATTTTAETATTPRNPTNNPNRNTTPTPTMSTARVDPRAGALGCRISEFTCSNYECVPTDAYCDGVPDCADRSDEPRDCSPCNRTFYGDVGRSYEVKVEKPKDMGTTFTCHLTFVAEGREFGDIVQLTIQEFSRYSHLLTRGSLRSKDTLVGRPSP
ncbi:hypothetical protein C7M84_022279 [Penaeus vannamei]|uniref:CUB domain-containing protein n=1 Tax=Penaeus vannamei TaxID=6689 RepID=A0A423U769_PENVA|nr:hypothetical protein C7M84_022279 [Penaeus vannamei]